jgi:hypothetical protein
LILSLIVGYGGHNKIEGFVYQLVAYRPGESAIRN